MKKLFVLLLVVGAMLTSCQEKETEMALLFDVVGLSPIKDTIPSEGTVRIHVYSRSLSSQVKHIVFNSYDDKYLTQGVLDTVFQDPLRVVNFEFLWTLKEYTQLTNVTLKGNAYSVGGDQMGYSIGVKVGATTRTLRPLDNITLYSAASEGKCGFSMVDLIAVYPDTERRDSLIFYDNTRKIVVEDEETPQTETADQLSRIWYSNSGLYFARFESFNYAEATADQVITAYAQSQHYPKIENIHDDDVLLVGTAQQALGVIKVMLVSDQEGVANDRYIFSLKALSNQ